MAPKPGDKDEPGTAVGDGTGHYGTLVSPLRGPGGGTRPDSWDHVFVCERDEIGRVQRGWVAEYVTEFVVGRTWP